MTENPIFEGLVKALGGLGIAESSSGIPEEIQSCKDPVDVLRAVYVLLGSRRGITISDNDVEENRKALREIAEHVGNAMLPILDIEPSDEDKTDYKSLELKGQLGLRILNSLTEKYDVELGSRTLISTVAFSSSDDSWTTTASAELSRKLLEDHFGSQVEQQQKRARFIAEDVLYDFLRPLFSKSRPATVTASGRKAEFVEPSRYDNASAEAEAQKPWKYGRRYAITVFGWALLNSDESILQKSWHLFTPVLLTLLDEPQTALKVRALSLFRSFWARCPADLMRQTGLAQVFEDAIFPAVLYLPELTPVDESVVILGAAYPALMAIAGIGIGIDSESRATTDELQQNSGNPFDTFTAEQQKLLARIIREGILVGYHHASEHVRLVELLCEQLRYIINRMGILTIKHLKHLIPMVTEIITEPFGTQYPPGLSAAIRLLHAILRTCWPRIPHYSNDIIKALMICWLNVEEEDSFPGDDGHPGAAELEAELTKAADMLSAVMRAADIDMYERVSPLIKTEPHLGKLFKSASITTTTSDA
ncbi:hypothetical protein SLS62_009753 [Diatrype stigma]|uniref:Uncharacterized protein n=1 Tax=Diatrype stigma TaxID=117547 RepID=A0AAN9UEQ9_9PEZI